MTSRPLRIGTRGSPMALRQTAIIRDRLIAAHPELAEAGAVEIVTISTTGDRVQNRLLAEIGGKGLFAKEIEEALLAGRIDLAVHSLKDLETWLPDGLVIACVPPRDDPRDALCIGERGEPCFPASRREDRHCLTPPPSPIAAASPGPFDRADPREREHAAAQDGGR